jgi:hypothetical protein
MRVVLLPLKSGCNGLNVVEATHVFLIEPLLNVAMEAQAIGRVHRIGQEKATTVHRMIVEETVEERVRDLGCLKRAALKDGIGVHVEQPRWAARSKETVTLEEMQKLFQPASSASSASSSAQPFPTSSCDVARGCGPAAPAGSPASYVRELGAQAAERRLPSSARESAAGASSGGGDDPTAKEAPRTILSQGPANSTRHPVARLPPASRAGPGAQAHAAAAGPQRTSRPAPVTPARK